MKRLLLIGFALMINLAVSAQRDSCIFYAPNVITMDCSTGNDFQFSVVTDCAISSCTLMVFNRWGELMFESDSKNAVWDAYGKPQGQYYYIFKGYFFGGVGFEKTGTAELIH